MLARAAEKDKKNLILQTSGELTEKCLNFKGVFFLAITLSNRGEVEPKCRHHDRHALVRLEIREV